MLKFLSKRKRSRKALLVFIIAALAIGLIALFTIPGTGLLGDQPDNSAVVARVGSYDITLKELRDALSGYAQGGFRGPGSPSDPATLYAVYGQQALDSLIKQKLILYEADRLNLQATDQEVRERIRQIFNPWPGDREYRSRVRQAGLTELEYEDSLRAAISEEKLRSFASAAAQVSPEEVEKEYKRNNTNYKVRWVEFRADQFRDKVRATEADLRAFFEQHRAEFRINSEQRRAKYIFISQDKAAETIQIPDEELKKNFDPERHIEQIRVSQIVINIPKSDEKAEQEARKKAEDIVNRARGSEDFAALARQYSEDAKSRARGGDIGWINKKDKREPDDPLNRAFSMKKDEVSQPIRKADKFYILKVTDRKVPTFDQVRQQLLKEARSTKAYSKAAEIAAEAEGRFKETKSAEATADEINKKYGAGVAQAVLTDFFTEDSSMPNPKIPEIKPSVFALKNPGDIGERQAVSGGFVIPQYLERRDPRDPNFEEVKPIVEERYRNEKANQMALEEARRLASQARTPDALKSMAEALKLKVEERSGLTGSDSIGSLTAEADREPIYKLNPGEITAEPVKDSNSNSYVVAALLERKDADMGEKFQKERKSIEERLLQSRRSAFFNAYLAATEKRLKEEGKIRIYHDVIKSALAKSGPKS
jgi:peptidyl-prolyl cis-trans isomerase D